jgi:hypothetical protein
MDNRMKRSLFVFLFIILLLPSLQQGLSFFTTRKLYGYFVIAPDIELTWRTWWNAAYGEGKRAYINDHFGLRPEVLAINNEVDYLLFHKYHATWIAPGKDHYLFQTLHIDAYYGKDYIGYAPIRERMRQLKAVQDTLGRLGVTLILAYAPDKAFFYPEYFTDNYKKQKKGAGNFETYVRTGDSSGINQIDYNTWFVSLKNTSNDLLFTRQGIHWSVYGSWLAADSLVRYIEKHRNIRMPRPQWTTTEHTGQARDADDDLVKTLNLIVPFTKETYSYPIVSYHQRVGMVKPKVIYIGDSFLETWMREGFMDSTNTDWQIWSHFENRWNKDNPRDKSQLVIAGYDWKKEIKNTDCIVIMYTSFNLPRLADGFIENAYGYFYPEK